MKSSNLKLLRDDILLVKKKYPELEVDYKNGVPVSLEGFVDILDSNLNVRGAFNIRINIPSTYPYGFPSLRELSRIIPRVIDRHIYENGDCCLTILQKQILESRCGISILNFIEKYTIPYLANQIYFEEYGDWANGEYSHGDNGITQFYFEEIQTKEFAVVLKVLAIVLKHNDLERNAKCYCGSEKKFKKCHLEMILRLSLIGIKQLKNDFEMILIQQRDEKISDSNI